jgi:protein-tyrosine phosphatase
MLYYIYNTLYDLTSSFFYNPPSVNEIIPGLWLGNFKSAIDISFLQNEKIDFILNCTKNTPFFQDIYNKGLVRNLKHIETYRIPVNDNLQEEDFITMETYLKIVLPILVHKYIHEKKHILIHCQAGKQRSAIVVAALLKVLVDNNLINIKEIPKNVSNKKQFKCIYNYIFSKRSQVFTYGLRINFEPSFKRFFKF